MRFFLILRVHLELEGVDSEIATTLRRGVFLIHQGVSSKDFPGLEDQDSSMEVGEWRALHQAGPRLQPPHINRCDRHTNGKCWWVQATSSTIIEETGPMRLCCRVIGISVHSWAVVSRRTWFPFLCLVLLLVLPLCLQWRDMSWFHGHAERTTLVRFLVGLSRKLARLARLATKMRRGTFELAELLHCSHCGCTRPCVEYPYRQERRGLTGTVGQRLTNNAQSLFLAAYHVGGNISIHLVT